MAAVEELVKETATISQPEVAERRASGRVIERRRPGRMKYVSAELLPLLRNPTAPIVEPAPEVEVPPEVDAADRIGEASFVEDDLAPVKAIILASILSVPFWALAAVGAWRFLD